MRRIQAQTGAVDGDRTVSELASSEPMLSLPESLDQQPIRSLDRDQLHRSSPPVKDGRSLDRVPAFLVAKHPATTATR